MFSRISKDEKNLYADHLLTLSEADRYNRFAGNCRDESILKYVENIDFNRDLVLVYFDENHNVVAAAHVGIKDKTADIGISVSTSHRKRGFGKLLCQRAILFARIYGCESIITQCLRVNRTMVSLAKQSGMNLQADGQETYAYKETTKLDIFDYGLWLNQIISENIVTLEKILKPLQEISKLKDVHKSLPEDKV